MNALTQISSDSSELVITIERARSALDAGDVQTAYLLSSGAYEQAKAAAGYAEKVKASRELIDKARRMQADALKIESLCTVAMADVVDEAQAQGKVSRKGRPENVQGTDIFSLEEVGISRQRLHEARHLRNAERANPGFIDRVVETRVNEGFEPSRAALKNAAGHAIGTKSRSKEERGVNAYFTPSCGTKALLALESFSALVLEPACGDGGISSVLEDAGYDVSLADLVDRGTTTRHGELQQVGDFLLSSPSGESPDIVTNPPYGKDILNKFIAHALRVYRPRKMALLLNANFMFGCEDPDRIYCMEECPPSRVYVLTRRLPMMHQEGWEGNEVSSQMNTCWFVWERNDDGSYGQGWPQLIRVDYKKHEGLAPLSPGAGGNVGPVVFSGKPEADEFARETPRKSVDERVDEELARALVWAGDAGEFDAMRLRQGIAVRPSVADALIVAMAEKGLIEAVDGGLWKISDRGADLISRKAWLVDVLSDSEVTVAGIMATEDQPSAPDPLYQSALDVVRRTARASVSLFKKELSLGHVKAAGLMERLIADDLVSEPDKAGQRVVFMEKLEGAA